MEVVFRDFNKGGNYKGERFIYTENESEAAIRLYFVEENKPVPHTKSLFPESETKDGIVYSVLGFAYPPYASVPENLYGNIVLNASRILGINETSEKVVFHEIGHAIGLLHAIKECWIENGKTICKKELMRETVGQMSYYPTEPEYGSIRFLYNINLTNTETPCDTVYITKYVKETVYDTVFIDKGGMELNKFRQQLKNIELKSNSATKNTVKLYFENARLKAEIRKLIKSVEQNE